MSVSVQKWYRSPCELFYVAMSVSIQEWYRDACKLIYVVAMSVSLLLVNYFPKLAMSVYVLLVNSVFVAMSVSLPQVNSVLRRCVCFFAPCKLCLT